MWGTISAISRRFDGNAIDAPATARRPRLTMNQRAGPLTGVLRGMAHAFHLRHIFNIEVAAIATIVLCVALIVYVLLSIWGITGFPE